MRTTPNTMQAKPQQAKPTRAHRQSMPHQVQAMPKHIRQEHAAAHPCQAVTPHMRTTRHIMQAKPQQVKPTRAHRQEAPHQAQKTPKRGRSAKKTAHPCQVARHSMKIMRNTGQTLRNSMRSLFRVLYLKVRLLMRQFLRLECQTATCMTSTKRLSLMQGSKKERASRAPQELTLFGSKVINFGTF